MAGSMLKVEGQGHSCLQQEKGQDSVDRSMSTGCVYKGREIQMR